MLIKYEYLYYIKIKINFINKNLYKNLNFFEISFIKFKYIESKFKFYYFLI